MNRVSDLEQQLRKAQERLDLAAEALAPKHKGGEMEEYWAAQAALPGLERELAAEAASSLIAGLTHVVTVRADNMSMRQTGPLAEWMA